MADHEETPGTEVLEMRVVRDDLNRISIEHEQREHGGEACLTFRCNAIAFLVHCIGLRQPHLARVSELLEAYEGEHVHEPIDGTNLIAMDRETHRRATRGEDPHRH